MGIVQDAGVVKGIAVVQSKKIGSPAAVKIQTDTDFMFGGGICKKPAVLIETEGSRPFSVSPDIISHEAEQLGSEVVIKPAENGASRFVENSDINLSVYGIQKLIGCWLVFFDRCEIIGILCSDTQLIAVE